MQAEVETVFCFCFYLLYGWSVIYGSDTLENMCYGGCIGWHIELCLFVISCQQSLWWKICCCFRKYCSVFSLNSFTVYQSICVFDGIALQLDWYLLLSVIYLLRSCQKEFYCNRATFCFWFMPQAGNIVSSQISLNIIVDVTFWMWSL